MPRKNSIAPSKVDVSHNISNLPSLKIKDNLQLWCASHIVIIQKQGSLVDNERDLGLYQTRLE